MKFINKTKNSVQLDDIAISIPYYDGMPQEIDNESLKKSFAFQQMVSMGGFEVVEASQDRIEQNLLRLTKRHEEVVAPIVERPLSGLKTEVVLRGHFYESSGYAKVNRNLTLNLARQGVAVEIEPISTKNNDLNEVEARMLGLFRKQVGKGAIFIDSVVPTHAKPSKLYHNILYTTCESNAVPTQFIEAAEKYDEVWVTSNFCKQAFLASGMVKDIVVVPPIINSKLYAEGGSPYSFRPHAKSFVFCSVLTWGYRKGSDALLKAFCSTFTAKDDVSLVLLVAEKSRSRQKEIKDEICRTLAEYRNPPQVLCCMKNIPEYHMPSFYAACNVFVLPSRGEGFGLPYCEASLCGLPVISTKYGGQLDFLSDENSFLVEIDDLEIAQKGQTGVHFWDGHLFPSLRSDNFIERLAEVMRYVYSNITFAKEKNKKLQALIAQSFSGESVGFQAKTRLAKTAAKIREQHNDSFSRPE
jgi:glycosyltransferase involved in cell wall biosynthesis